MVSLRGRGVIHGFAALEHPVPACSEYEKLNWMSVTDVTTENYFSVENFPWAFIATKQNLSG